MCAVIAFLLFAALVVIGVAALWRVIVLAILAAALVVFLVFLWRRFRRVD
jgi:hypothetical protein